MTLEISWQSFLLVFCFPRIKNGLLTLNVVWFSLVWFNGISTIVGYLMSNPIFTFILNICCPVGWGCWIHRLHFCSVLDMKLNNLIVRCPWCNGYRRRKWTRRHEFKSWTRLIAFHIALIPLGKVWIQSFSLQLWVNSRTD